MAIVESIFRSVDKKAIIYGVIFDSEMIPQYCRMTNKTECVKLCGSKYVYCNPSNCIKSIENDLVDNKTVVFVGTPCNIDITKRIERDGIDLNGLVTIDLICNGTPSLPFWKEYVHLLEKKYNRKLVEFNFRKKGDKSNPYMTEAIFSGGLTIKDSNVTAAYNQVFLKKLSIREGCFYCKYKSFERVADITLGDFWGIEKSLPGYISKDRPSIVLLNTRKGEEIFQNVLSDDKVYTEEVFNDNYLLYQNNLVKNSNKPKEYDKFKQYFRERGIDYALRYFSDYGGFGTIKYHLRKIARRAKYAIHHLKKQ